ncbi:hypothetical protein D3C76_771960 [compost metagenome]
MQRHQHAADQVANEDGDDAPDQVQVKHLHAEGAGDDGQGRDVATEPQGEQVAGLAMTILRRHVADRVFLDERGARCCSGYHDELQGKVSTWTYFGERRANDAFLVGAIMCNGSG